MTPKLCKGTSKRTGEPCQLRAGFGTDHVGNGNCKFHGGATQNGKKAAQREQAEEAVATYGLPREVDPLAALLEELHRTAGHVAWLWLEVQKLEPERLHGPVGGGRFSIPKEEAHVWVRLYQEERRHFTDVAKTCAACGIAERQIAILEEHARWFAERQRLILSDLGLDPEDEKVREVVRFRLIEGGEAA